MKRLISVLLMLVPLAVAAQDNAIVRLEIEPQSVKVGEVARLQVTVLGPTWFAKAPVFPNFEVPNAIVRLPPNSTHPVAQQVGGERWSGVSRVYEVIPLMAARYALGGQSVRLTIAKPGSDPEVVDAPLPEVELLATVPAGAEGLDPYLAGTSLTLSREILGDQESLEPGDAVVVETTAEIEGLLALFLPPLLPEFEAEGLFVYPEEPRIEDGDTGMRSEKTTLVFNAGGEFRLPAVELAWWNVQTGQVETASVPEQVFLVEGPVMADTEQPGADERDWTAWIAPVAGVILLAYLFWSLFRRLTTWLEQRRGEITASEPYAFARLEKAIAREEPGGAYSALTGWLHRLDPRLDVHRFVRDYGDDALRNDVRELSKTLYRSSARKLRWQRLAKGLFSARRAYLDQRPDANASAVPPLNP